MIVVRVFFSILKQMEFHLVQNRKENCPQDYIPFNVIGNGNIVFSCATSYPKKNSKSLPWNFISCFEYAHPAGESCSQLLEEIFDVFYRLPSLIIKVVFTNLYTDAKSNILSYDPRRGEFCDGNRLKKFASKKFL